MTSSYEKPKDGRQCAIRDISPTENVPDVKGVELAAPIMVSEHVQHLGI